MHRDVSLVSVAKRASPQFEKSVQIFTSHLPMMVEKDQVTLTNWPASKKKWCCLVCFVCRFSFWHVLVARFVDWIRPDSAIGAVFSLAAPVRVQFYFFSLYLTFLFLVTWLRAFGTLRKKRGSLIHAASA